MTRFFMTAAVLAFAATPSFAQEKDIYQAETPSLNSCIEAAGSDGETTQAELDACIKANMGELTAALPEVAGGATVGEISPTRQSDSATGGKDETVEES